MSSVLEAAQAAPVAALDHVSRAYRMGQIEVRALDDFCFTFRQGEYWAVMGSSGSGKSTLLNILGCLDRPNSGSYQVRGEDTASLDDDALSELRSRHLGFVFQNYNLLPQLNVLENILVPIFYQDEPPPNIEAENFCTHSPRSSPPKHCERKSRFVNAANIKVPVTISVMNILRLNAPTSGSSIEL